MKKTFTFLIILFFMAKSPTAQIVLNGSLPFLLVNSSNVSSGDTVPIVSQPTQGTQNDSAANSETQNTTSSASYPSLAVSDKDSVMERLNHDLESYQKTITKGVGLFSMGFVFTDLIAIPLIISTFTQESSGLGPDIDVGMLPLAVAAGTAGYILKGVGPAFCISGASKVLEKSGSNHSKIENEIRVCYTVGWVTRGVGHLLLAAAILNETQKSDSYLVGSIVTGLLADGLWLVTVCKSSALTKKAVKAPQKKVLNINVLPTYSYKENSAGMVLNCSF